MKIVSDSRAFRAETAWGALDLAEIDGATIRLHWADEPYAWHVNDGPEVFAVVDGEVDMHYRQSGEDRVVRLRPGSFFIVEEGDEHFAHPVGEARILVIERKGSV